MDRGTPTGGESLAFLKPYRVKCPTGVKQADGAADDESSSRSCRLALSAILVSCVAVVTAITTSAFAEGSPKDEKIRIEPAVQARVRDVMLRRADFPAGWTGRGLTDEGARRCTDVWDPDLSRVTITGRARSQQFMSGPQYVSSEGEAYATASQLTFEWRAITTSDFVRCLRRIAERALNESGLRAKVQGFRPIRLPRFARLQAGWRFRIRVVSTTGGTPKTVDAWTDVVYFARGRALVGLSFTSFFAPPDDVIETRLVRLMDRRLGKLFPS